MDAEAVDDSVAEAAAAEAAAAEAAAAREPVADVASCPSCAFVIDPAPRSSRRCPRCRERIVVRRVEGRTVYLTEAAVEVFEAQRQHDLDMERWDRERREWLERARIAGAADDRRERLAARPLDAPAVEASKALYLSAVEVAVRAAKREKHWAEVGRFLRDEAAALYHEAGSPVPPPDDIAGIHREAMAAMLRVVAPLSKNAELVGAGCCKPCRFDDGKAFRISDELRVPRLPHEGCPRGLCACEWWLSLPDPTAKRRRRTARPAAPVTTPEAAPAPADAAPAAAEPMSDAAPVDAEPADSTPADLPAAPG